MKTPITDKKIERLQFLFDNDAIDTEEIKELIELKELKKALGLSDVVERSQSGAEINSNGLAKHSKRL